MRIATAAQLTSAILLLSIYLSVSSGVGESALASDALKKYEVLSQLPFTWRNIRAYYYATLRDKLDVILNGNCKSSLTIFTVNSTVSAPPVGRENEVFVFPQHVNESLKHLWLGMPRPRQMRVDPFLCQAVHLKKRPIFNNTGCQLPHYMNPSAPRCQTSYLRWACDESKMLITDTHPNGFVLPEADHKHWIAPPDPWILSVRDSLVTMCGQISSDCGLIHTTANCMATGQKTQSMQFQKTCPLSQFRSAASNGTVKTCLHAPFSDEVQYVDRVFVVAEVDDTYIYHVHLEIVPRIVQHLQFLEDNPDVMILIGCDIKDKKRGGQDGSLTRQGLQAGMKALRLILQLFPLPAHRFIVHRNIYAREVFLPMEGGCQDPVYNAWTVLAMRNKALQQLGIPTGYRRRVPEKGESGISESTADDYSSQDQSKPVMLLMKRSAESEHSRNRFDLVRQWSEDFTARLMAALESGFPEYNVKLFSDKDENLMHCFACQVRLAAQADVMVGVHGAGLGMSLYMPPGKAVVELAPYGNDGRCLLGGGPFSRLAAVMAHNYLMHHPPYDEFKWIAGKSSEFNISRFVTHIQSFLTSISD